MRTSEYWGVGRAYWVSARSARTAGHSQVAVELVQCRAHAQSGHERQPRLHPIRRREQRAVGVARVYCPPETTVSSHCQDSKVHARRHWVHASPMPMVSSALSSAPDFLEGRPFGKPAAEDGVRLRTPLAPETATVSSLYSWAPLICSAGWSGLNQSDEMYGMRTVSVQGVLNPLHDALRRLGLQHIIIAAESHGRTVHAHVGGHSAPCSAAATPPLCASRRRARW